MKFCTKCQTTKTLAEFHVDKTKKDGRKTRCIVCVRAYVSDWQKANPDKASAKQRRAYAANPQKKCLENRKRQTVQLGAEQGYAPPLGMLQMWYGNQCLWPECTKESQHVDHVVPLSKGGAHAVWNFQPLCEFHNISKGNRSSDDYRTESVWLDRVSA